MLMACGLSHSGHCKSKESLCTAIDSQTVSANKSLGQQEFTTEMTPLGQHNWAGGRLPLVLSILEGS